jgi:hypothetical protein
MTRRELAESIAAKLTSAHLRLLEVCYGYPKGESGIFCGEWIMSACEQQGVPFHQGWLTKLANVGLLVKDDSSRRGHRRYYRLKDAELVRDVLALAGAVR